MGITLHRLSNGSLDPVMRLSIISLFKVEVDVYTRYKNLSLSFVKEVQHSQMCCMVLVSCSTGDICGLLSVLPSRS